MPDDLGPWEPLSIGDLAQRLGTGAPFTWWIAGGEALDLFVGHQTRSHADVDASILRSNATRLIPRFPGWDLRLAHAGTLEPWDGGPISAPFNSLWCRRRPTEPWRVQIMLEEGDEATWVCRRFPALTMPMPQLIRSSTDGIPYVAPEVQLFMKAKDPRPKDEDDFALVYPLLTSEARTWLTDALRAYYPGHPWLDT